MLKNHSVRCHPPITLPVLLGILFGAKRNFATPRGVSALAGVLGIAGFSGLGGIAIAPQVAIAGQAQASISLVRQGDESFETLLRRAEAIARAATQRVFDREILVTEVSITILGENNGAVLPILVLNVSRQDWRKEPDPQRWAKYFPNAPILLGLEEAPPPPPTAEPPPPPETETPEGETPDEPREDGLPELPPPPPPPPALPLPTPE